MTGDSDLDASVRQLRDYGQTAKYHHTRLGYNRRLDTLQAAVLRVKLAHLDRWNQSRRDLADLYTRLLIDQDLLTPAIPDYSEPVWHLYIIQIENRDSLKEHLAQNGVSAGIHYPIPIHLQPAFEYLGRSRGDLPITELLADRMLSLPMYPELAPEQVQYVVHTIQEF